MKIQCLQESLERGLNIVKRAASSRATLPVLEHILVQADDGRLRLSATNLEIGLTTTVGARIEEQGGITVPVRTLVDLVKAFPRERVDLEVDEKTATLALACGRHEAHIKGLPTSEFPVIPAQIDGGMELQATNLVMAIRQAAISAATDESRPILNGVLFKADADELTLAAADGFRLSVNRVAFDGVLEPFEVIVPVKAMRELVSLAPEKVQMQVENNGALGVRIIFDLDGTVLTSQLIDGRFPDYNQIVPKDHTTRAVLPTAQFEQALKAVAIFARDADDIVRLDVGTDAVQLSAQSAETGDGTVTVQAVMDGPAVEIAFNVAYLLSFLAVVDTPNVVLETTNPSSPGVLRPEGDNGFTYVIMPMHLGQ